MFDRVIERFFNFITSRLTVLTLFFLVLGGILVYRCFDLQIVQGQEYLDKFILQTEKTRDISSSRGTIYDRNGVALAYNELAYSVKIEDVVPSGRGKNAKLNETIYKLIKMIEKNGDNVISDFHVVLDESNEFIFDVEGTKLLRFLADVYGETYTTNLTDEQKNATPWEVITFLAGNDTSTSFSIGDYEIEGDSSSDFVVGKGYTNDELLKMVNIRYAMRLTSFRKYVGTVVAKDVSDETVAVILENINELEGVTIVEDTVRRYYDSTYFAHILGYTGTISSEALETLNAKNLEEGDTGDRYDINDVVGKSGIEEYMETTLQGNKGYEKVSVDNTGRVTSIIERKEASSGKDVYLTIDSELQKAAYQVLEQHIAGIVASKIINTKSFELGDGDNSDIKIPIYDVYFAVINNSVIDITEFNSEDGGETAKAVYEKFLTYKEGVYERLYEELYNKQTIYDDLTLEYQNYQSFIVDYLKKNGVLDTSLIDYEDATQIAWANEEVISLTEYLNYCIAMNWIDVTKLDLENQYSASEEIFSTLYDYILTHMETNVEFHKKIYRFMIKNDVLSGIEVCKLLCEQKAIEVPAEEEDKLYEGKISAYQFMMNRIQNLDITPAQLALDPCSGTVVISDVNNGDVLALVTYPGYDNNKMANSVDPEYYAKLLSDKSQPLYNFATQYSAAPGSTFKPVSATAALCEGLISLSTKTTCVGAFRYVDPAPYCWKRWGHGTLDVTGAIANSCNYFFYDVGYKFAMQSGGYVAEDGLNVLEKYAAMFGLTEKTGIEISETQPKASEELPIPSAIGQGTNSYTAAGLNRYAATIASNGNCYNLTLLDSVKDSNGTLLQTYDAELYNKIDMSVNYWDAIQAGMRTVVENKVYFNDLSIQVAGKTGTAEQVSDRPNHALFISYGPYEDPEIAVTVRIPFGYSSDYAAKVARDVYAYYYGLAEEEDILTGTANEDNTGVSNNEM